MTRTTAPPTQSWPRWWRLTILALSVLILCSCTQVAPRALPSPAPPSKFKFAGTPSSSETLGDKPAASVVRAVERSAPLPIAADCGCSACQAPLAESAGPAWKPPGIACPWPPDEYLCDGGDGQVRAKLGAQDETGGLEVEDTVAHYVTADGQRRVEPSNRICIYAPRFAAVRKLESALVDQQNDAPRAASKPIKPDLEARRQPARVARQPLPARIDVAVRAPAVARLKQPEARLASDVALSAVQDGVLPYENERLVREGLVEAADKARLLVSIDAAVVWSHDLGVQVILDQRRAVEVTGDARAQATFTVDTPQRPKLRIVKMASTSTARPGDTVEFTLRFDNLGDQELRQVTIVDNLTTRLEYVPDTAQSSVPARFSTETNSADSLVLRWELSEPLRVGAGGVLRFHCRVR